MTSVVMAVVARYSCAPAALRAKADWSRPWEVTIAWLREASTESNPGTASTTKGTPASRTASTLQGPEIRYGDLPVVQQAQAFDSLGDVQRVEPDAVAAAAPQLAPRQLRASIQRAMPVTANGTHMVQLGSFSSQQGARRAWGIYTARNASLSGYRMNITPAVVNGKNVWRVAAAGISGAGAANGLCSSVKKRGGACFAYAAPSRGKAPAAPGREASGPMMAEPAPTTSQELASYMHQDIAKWRRLIKERNLQLE